MQTFVFDIDHVLADPSRRPRGQSQDWAAWRELIQHDAPIVGMVEIVRALKAARHHIVLMTSRGEACRDQTTAWLAQHAIPYDMLLMRPEGNCDRAYNVKLGLLQQLREAGHTPVLAFDDHEEIALMFRSCGIRCALVSSPWR